MKINCKDIYTTYLQLILQSETVSWNRFNNFLIINSILLLAWATLFTSTSTTLWPDIVMYAICVLGILSTIAWADIGKRGRKYLDLYKAKAKSIEEKEDCWEDNIENKDKPFQEDIKPNCYSSSYYLLGRGPYFFGLMYIILIFATIYK